MNQMACRLLRPAFMRPSLLIALAGCALLQTASPPRARACSGVPCTIPAAFPVPEGGELPANFGELTVFSESAFPRTAPYTIKLWEEGSPDKLLRTVKVGPDNQNRAELGDLLAPGKSYVVEATSCGKDYAESFEASVRTLHFKLAQAASAVPDTLGALAVTRHGPTTVAWGMGASCYADLDTNAVDLTLDTSALPEAWRELVNSYQLMVDGEPFSWTLTIGSDTYGPRDTARGFYFTRPGTFRAFTECEPSRSSDLYGGPAAPEQKERGLAPGKHTLWVAARVPTSPARVVESQRIEFELSCPEPAAVTSHDRGADAATRGDAGADQVAASEERDAGAQDPTSTGESSADDPKSAPAKAEDGCTLTQRGPHAANWPAHGLLVVVLALLRRKRAVRSRHTRRSSARKRS